MSLRSKPLLQYRCLEMFSALMQAARRCGPRRLHILEIMSLRSKPLLQYRCLEMFSALMQAARRCGPRRLYILEIMSLRSKPLLQYRSRLSMVRPAGLEQARVPVPHFFDALGKLTIISQAEQLG